MVAMAAAYALVVAGASDAKESAAARSGPVGVAQVLELERTGVPSPVGLAFSPAGSAFYVVERAGAGAADTDVAKVTPLAVASESDRTGTARIAAAVGDPINMAFDARRSRLLLLANDEELLEVPVGAGGEVDAARLSRRAVAHLGLREPQGMAVDPASGTVFVLDAEKPRIVRVEPGPDGSFDRAATSEIDLRPGGMSGARGIAFDPSTGYLHVQAGDSLYEVTTAGEVIAVRDLQGLGLVSPEGIVFAPSGDRTDDPGRLDLYVADRGGGATESAGQIAELSLTTSAAQAVAAGTFNSTLQNTVNLANLSPPSPDPSGITYVPTGDKLVVSDAEVEETINGITHFQGANLWELTRLGAKIRTANISRVPPTVVPMTDEPAGAAYNPNNGHYYFSADGSKKVFDLDPGADGLLGTSDDSWTFFSTEGVGNTDPEGIAYDTFGGHLFVADGLNREVYEYTTTGALVRNFDVQVYGVEDPESIEFNTVSGTLFVLGNAASDKIVETTVTGTLVNTINLPASLLVKPAGVAYAPASGGGVGGAKRFYIVDRGIDNDTDPNAVDGKMYELTAPVPAPPANLPPSVSAGPDRTATLPAAASLDGSATDDGNPGPLTTTWTQVSGPGTVTFGNPNAVDTTVTASVPGVYVVRLTGNDGQFTDSDEATVTFAGSGGTQSIDVPVATAGDDAEEVAGSGLVQRGDVDLDMLTDNDNTKAAVGLRFTGVAIPPGTTIASAHVQFQAEEAHNVATTLTVKGEAADNPPAFNANVAFDISSRPTTTAAATWVADPWLAVGDAGVAQRTSNLAAVLQQIVNRPGWTSGNAIVVIITGNGRRVAAAENHATLAPPVLHVEWSGSSNSPPVITSDGGGATASRSVAENQTAVTTVTATDPDSPTLSYSITGGADAAHFTIGPSNGVLTFVSAPNYEAPTDQGPNNVYDVTVTVSDGEGGSDSQALAVTVLNVNEFAPVITSDGGGPTAALSRPEGQTAVTDVNAADADGDPVTYTITGGADQGDFVINPTTGVLTFATPPDFENPSDENGDNVYLVTVSATDGSLSDSQALSVTVTAAGGNVAPTVSAGPDQTITLPASASLNGTVTDDGLPAPPSVTTTWSKFSGPGTVTFGNPSAVDTTASFSSAGTYILRLTADDGALQSSDEITITVNPAGTGGSPLYFSLASGATVGGVAAANEDVLFFNGTAFSMHFDGSDVGLQSFDIDAFARLDADSLLFSFINPGTVPGIGGTVDDSDIVRFDATSLGSVTAGTFSLYFDGSDVGLNTDAHDIDALELLPDGDLLISTWANFVTGGITFVDKDLARFDPTSLGNTTAGTFSFYFDGSDVDLAAGDEDVDAAAVDGSGRILLSVRKLFAVNGVSGLDEDVFRFNPTSTGANTTGSYDPALYFDGSTFGVTTNVSAIDLP